MPAEPKPHSSTSATPERYRRLKLGAFVAVLYAYCAAGPFGFEEMVSDSGPGMALLFLLVVPWLYSLPVSMATAEMAAIMPVQGGFYRWTRAAFGNFWGFQCGWWNWTGTFLMNAAYAVALADYTGQLFPYFSRGGAHWLAAVFFLLLVAAVNIAGVELVGASSMALLAMVLAIAAAFTVVGALRHKVDPLLPFIAPGKSWREIYGVGLSLAMWCYSGYEQLSTNIEEVEEPERNFPRALALIVPLAMITFLLPTAAGIAGSDDWQRWTTGYMVTAAHNIGGNALAWPMFAAAMVSIFLGLQSTVLSGTRLPFAMAEDGYFPTALARLHQRFRTPVASILLSTAICAALAAFELAQLITVYIWLRVATTTLTLLCLPRLRGTATRSAGYRVPGGALGMLAVVGVPVLLFAWVILNSDHTTLIFGPVALALGLAAYPLVALWQRRFTQRA